MAKRRNRLKNKACTKQKNCIHHQMEMRKNSVEKPLKVLFLLEFIKQLPFWWQQSKDFRAKMFEWLINLF